MRKSLLVTLEYPPQVGGVSVYYDHAVKCFPHQTVAVLTVDETGGRIIGDSVSVFRRKLLFTSRWVWPKWLPLLWHMRHIAKKERAQLIQVGNLLPVGTAALVLKIFFRVPYFVYTHGMDVMLASERPRKRSLARRILKSAEFIVANSEFTKRQVAELGVPVKNIITVSPCPNTHLVRTVSDQEQMTLRAQYRLENKKILLTTGRLVERKGHDIVLSVLAKLKEEMPDVHYVIVGEGPRRPEIEQMVTLLGLEDHVTMVGEVTERQLAAWYAVSDVFIMISRKIGTGDIEGFGIVYLEANMFGKPVIAGKSGGTEDAVIDGVTGRLVDPTNPDEVQSVVKDLLTRSDQAQKMGENGRKRVQEEFQWSEQVGPLFQRIEKI